MNSRPLNCREAQELITLQVDHRLSADDCQALKTHLSLCQVCDKEYHTEKEVKELLSKHCKSVKIPDKLNTKISELLSNPDKMSTLSANFHEESPQLYHTQTIFNKKRNLAVLTLCLAVIFFVSVYIIFRL